MNPGKALEVIEKGFITILEGLRDGYGLDLDDENLKDTPKRVAKMYGEIFAGLSSTEDKVQNILKSKFPCPGYDQMITCSGVKVFSLCPHHFLPVEMIVDLAYIPSKKGYVLGLSKLARISELLASRPVMQEQLTEDIGKALSIVKPKGCMVQVRGKHGCMRIRGIKKDGVITTTHVSGAFKKSAMTREEFFSSIDREEF